MYWRKIQSIGLQSRYTDDVEFALQIRQLAALAFVPEQDVIRFQELIESEYNVQHYDVLQQLID